MDTVLIEITSTETDSFSGISKNNGKPFNITNQQAFLFADKSVKYPTPFKITLEDNQAPYPVGQYVLKSSSVHVDRFGRLSIRPQLEPAKAALSRAS